MAMMTGSANRVKSDINITPLVDVVLVLLIIFMVVTPVLRVGYEATVPPKGVDRGPVQPTTQLVVRLAEDGKLFINSEPVATDAFVARLREVLKGRGTEPTFVAASGKARYEQVMAFIDTCHDAGVASPAIVLDELEH
jgi:biopolymer transport protein TolR